MIRRLCKDCKRNDENGFCNDCGYFHREITASCWPISGSRSVDVTRKTSNADRIRAMTDEELANVMYRGCPPIKVDRCPTKKDGGIIDCVGCWLDWLKQEAQK